MNGFRHEALLYADEAGFMAGVLPFVQTALARRAPVLVAVDAQRAARLREALGADAARVRFAAMAELGRNPGRIISAWHDFVGANGAGATPLYGVGEPIWPGRSAAELTECHRHEALLNLAFADAAGFELICPYDASALPAGVVAEACRTHPHVREGDAVRTSDAYVGSAVIAAPFDGPLDPAAAPAPVCTFDAGTLGALRAWVGRAAVAAGLVATRREDLVLAVDELASNSVRHGGGRGTLRTWREDDALVCEIRDGGRIAEPLAGRRRPTGEQPGGYGMWLVHQLCDLVEVRSGAAGSVVRVRMRAT